MPLRGEGAPQSVVEPLQSEQDAGIPKRQILRRRHEFYYGENDPPLEIQQQKPSQIMTL